MRTKLLVAGCVLVLLLGCFLLQQAFLPKGPTQLQPAKAVEATSDSIGGTWQCQNPAFDVVVSAQDKENVELMGVEEEPIRLSLVNGQFQGKTGYSMRLLQESGNLKLVLHYPDGRDYTLSRRQ